MGFGNICVHLRLSAVPTASLPRRHMTMSPTMETLGGFVRLALWAGCLFAGVSCASRAEADDRLQWQKLPPIPDAEGFAGAFAGVSGGALIVAGGANIAGDKWAEP